MESSALVYVALTLVTVFLGFFVESYATVPEDGEIVRGRSLEWNQQGASFAMNRGRAKSAVAEFAVFCLLTGVSACRIAVGNDYWVYRFNFRLIAQERHVSSEFGFNLIVKWMQQLFGYDNYLPIFALFSFLTVLFFVRALHGQAVNYAFSLFLLMTGGYYFNSLNTVRYYLALAIALYSMQYILRREYGKFILWVLLGSIFHKSILLVIPVYLAVYVLARIRPRRWMYVVGGVFLCSLFVCRNFYREIVFYFYPYYRGSEFDTGNVSWVNIAKCTATLLLCVLFGRESLHKSVTNRFYFYLNLAALVVYPCGSFIPEVSRVGYYMMVSQIFLIPAVLKDMQEGWIRRFCHVGVCVFFTLYFAFLLKGMYATDIRLLPYLNWIFN